MDITDITTFCENLAASSEEIAASVAVVLHAADKVKEKLHILEEL